MTGKAAGRKPRPSLWRALGPGLVSGAADDDPSGIATYSQAGAQYGYGFVWTMVLTLPFMAAIQETSARIGFATGHGLAAAIRHHFPRWLLYAIVGLLLFANTLNIAADIAAMADALRLVIGGPRLAYALGFGFLCLTLEILVPFHRYEGWLKYLTLVLFVYVGAALSVSVPWGEVFFTMIAPPLSANRDWILMLVAVFGTTISPYLFFWQASQEVEDRHLQRQPAPETLPDKGLAHLARIRIDTLVGMGFASLIALFIMVTTAATLHVHGLTDITSSTQAAEALRPIAGQMTFALFAAGIIGTGLLAVPVLAGSAAYAVADTAGWRGSLESRPTRAKGFYAIIATATLGGVLIDFTPVDPFVLLFWTAVVNGVCAVPIMIVMMLVVGDPKIMGEFRASRRMLVFGWGAAIFMACAALALLTTSLTDWLHPPI